MITLYYLKMAVRFLMRARSYTIINLLGLAFSLACSIILIRYIHRELTVDAGDGGGAAAGYGRECNAKFYVVYSGYGLSGRQSGYGALPGGSDG